MQKWSLLLLCLPILVSAQTLSPERVARIKAATVQLSVEGIEATGSAFYISPAGELLTCWHLIDPAFRTDSLGNIRLGTKIIATNSRGEQKEYGIPAGFLNRLGIRARDLDYCLLAPVVPFDKPVVFLPTGNFDQIPEGQAVYSCGYPNALNQPFISMGRLSTKYTDSSTYKVENGVQQKITREVALLDLAMNKSNSGGPVMVMGNTMENDLVIGIANQLITPFGQVSEDLRQIAQSKSSAEQAGNNASLANVLSSIKLFTSVFVNASQSISACLSINHFVADIQSLSK